MPHDDDARLKDRATTISPEEAAERLGVKHSTLNNFRWNGRGPRFQKVGGKVRYRLVDLAAWLDSQTHTSTSDDRTETSPSVDKER